MSEENVTPYKGAHLRSHQKNNQSTLVVLPDKQAGTNSKNQSYLPKIRQGFSPSNNGRHSQVSHPAMSPTDGGSRGVPDETLNNSLGMFEISEYKQQAASNSVTDEYTFKPNIAQSQLDA